MPHPGRQPFSPEEVVQFLRRGEGREASSTAPRRCGHRGASHRRPSARGRHRPAHHPAPARASVAQNLTVCAAVSSPGVLEVDPEPAGVHEHWQAAQRSSGPLRRAERHRARPRGTRPPPASARRSIASSRRRRAGPAPRPAGFRQQVAQCEPYRSHKARNRIVMPTVGRASSIPVVAPSGRLCRRHTTPTT